MEGKQLHPRVRHGVHTFDPDEVEQLARARNAAPAALAAEGEIAARCFESFASGATLEQIVCDLRIPPRVVRELYIEWKTGLAEGYARARADRNDALAAARQRRELLAQQAVRAQERHDLRIEREQTKRRKLSDNPARG